MMLPAGPVAPPYGSPEKIIVSIGAVIAVEGGCIDRLVSLALRTVTAAALRPDHFTGGECIGIVSGEWVYQVAVLFWNWVWIDGFIATCPDGDSTGAGSRIEGDRIGGQGGCGRSGESLAAA